MNDSAIWYMDEESFAFKEIHTLKMSDLKLIVLYDTKIDQVVTGTVIIDSSEYMEFDLKDYDVEHAKHELVLKAINIGSAVLMKKARTDPEGYRALLDNLADLYIMEGVNMKKNKEEFRKRYLKGEQL